MSQEYEGWSISARPAAIGLLAFLVAVVLFVAGTGWLYTRWYAAETRPDPKPFPAPALELIDTAPSDVRQVASSRPPAGIDHAMAATVAEGDALWGRK